MIGTIDVTVQAARPDLPLQPVRAFVGSPSSVRVRNVPRRIGEWDITRVLVTANYPDSTTETAECVLTGGVWVGTVRGCSTPGTSLSGFVVTADGVDEHGSAVIGYILGVGDVVVLTREESVTPGVITFKGDKGDKGDPGEVISVNGKVGAVSLGANDVGAYTKDETDAALSNKLDKTAVVAPSASATAGQAADAKAVNDALAGKVDSQNGVVKNSLAVSEAGFKTTFQRDSILCEVFDGVGVSSVIMHLPQKNGKFALTSDIEDAVKDKVGSFESVGGASATVENGVAKLSDFFTESNSLLNGRIAYERNETGLKDRAFNALTFDGTEYNLSTALAAVTPTASGQPRDLLIVATATAATTISFTAGTIKCDKPTIDGSGTWLITLTEYASGVWYCRQIKMEDVA